MGNGCSSKTQVIHPTRRNISIVSDESTGSVDSTHSIANVNNVKQILDETVRDLNTGKLKLSDFRTRLTENNVKVEKLLEPTLLNHDLILLLKKTLVTLLEKWNSSEIQSLNETERFTFRNIAVFLSEITEHFDQHTSSTIYRPFLSNMPFVQMIQQCLEDMAADGKHLTDTNDEYNLESFTHLLNVFRNFETSKGHSADEIQSMFTLLTSVTHLIRSRYYTETFLGLPYDATEFNTLQCFILDKCPAFLNAYKGKQSSEMLDTLLEQIFDHYVRILEHFLLDIEAWTSPVIRAMTHIIDTMINASLTAQTHIFQQPKIIEYALTILRSERFCLKLKSTHMTAETWLIDSILTGLHNMIYDPKLLAILKKKTVTPVFTLITSIATYDRIRIHAYLLLAGILSEAEIQKLNNGKEITMVFLKYLTKAMESPDKMFKGVTMAAILCGLKTLVQHDEIKDAILIQDKDLQLLSNIIFKTTGEELAHALSILWTLSFNKNVASTILKKSDLMNRIRLLAEKPKSDDQTNHNKENGIINDELPRRQAVTLGHLSQGLLKLSREERTKINKIVSSAAQGILWQVQGEVAYIEQQQQQQTEVEAHYEKPKRLPSSEKQSRPASTEKKYDVMISYSHDDKQLCHKIADHLIDDGFKIWIDKNNMSGSTPAAIADGIENSEIVLIGMTYSYKISPWCQREGNYAFQRQTKVIPLKLPPAYTPDGWLGLLVASLNYINFSKLEFDLAYEQLKKEIHKCRQQEAGVVPRLRLSNEERPTSSNMKSMNKTVANNSLNQDEYTYPPRSDGLYATKPLQVWTQQNVTDFLNDKRLYPMLLLCKDMDGPALYQLYTFCNDNSNVAFESFQKKLEKKFNNYDLSPIEYTCFLSEIKKLNLTA